MRYINRHYLPIYLSLCRLQNADCTMQYSAIHTGCSLVATRPNIVDRTTIFDSPVVARYHSLANRHSCSTLAKTQDRKCFSMQLILVVGKVDMINKICQMLSFCWKLLSVYFA